MSTCFFISQIIALALHNFFYKTCDRKIVKNYRRQFKLIKRS
nr:MAG TPA: hypothetical protein [Caudoviricetes sp.]